MEEDAQLGSGYRFGHAALSRSECGGIVTDQFAPGRLDYAQRAPRLPCPVKSGNAVLPLGEEVRLDLYERLQVIRQFEKRVYDLFLQNMIKGTSHLSLGMEATAAGFGCAMQPDDLTFATYRGHGHTLARGVPMRPVMAELLGRATGLLGGKGGSMHLTSVEHGVMGSYAIVGAHLCIANGAALAAQLRGDGQAVVAFFGDGATNTGAFHEALNLAAVWKLPVVFVCENNLYMEYTPIDLVTPVTHPAADRAGAYGLAAIVIDGNDPDEVYDTASSALAAARSGKGPVLIEALTYRSGGHSRADPGKYRPAEEVEAWRERDPVAVYHSRLLDLGVPERRLVDIAKDVARRVDDAAEFAIESPVPGGSALYADVWADGGAAWRN